MRIIGSDIRRVFAEAVALEGASLGRLGRSGHDARPSGGVRGDAEQGRARDRGG